MLRFGRQLVDALRLDLEGESALSYYATLDGGAPARRGVTRLVALVTAEFGSR